ncbi:MAG TPA: F0F1 ATP synthase subunit A [Candidatus Acidoferrum sp.]|nr:F0F1 ATP synthase subunit A [Candidatus Acidoferrum sp.]
MEQPIWVAVVVNRLLGKPAAALLAALHIQPANPEYPIPNSVSMEILVFIVAVLFFLWLKARISVDRPGATQQVMEMILTNPMGVGIRDLIKDNIHHGGEQYLPLIGTIGIFILFCNLINVIPTLDAPTATVTVPLGCAVIVFVYYNLMGIMKKGIGGHGKHFLGPIPAMAPLMLPIELFSHSFRLLSLTVRLWVNMLVSEMLYVIFLGMMLSIYVALAKLGAAGHAAAIFPLLIPLIFIILHIAVAILQAFVFTILPIIYVAGAVEEH